MNSTPDEHPDGPDALPGQVRTQAVSQLWAHIHAQSREKNNQSKSVPDATGSTPASASSPQYCPDLGRKMIHFTLVYQKNGEKRQVPVHHPVLPRVGEKVFPPREPQSMTVLTVEHDTDRGFIWVVLN